MRILLIVAWLFVGLGGVIYHLGPGQEKLEIDRVNAMLKKARLDVTNEDWRQAVDQFDEILAEIPAEKVAETRSVVLEKAKAQMMAAELPKAREALKELLQEVRSDEVIDKNFEAEVRSTLANSLYYTTWLMRREGQPEEEWSKVIEAARQHYVQLVEHSEASGDKAALKRHSEDLESAIRLKRMDLSELQALPLPSQ